MKGYSATQPLEIIETGGGYQFRYNIEQVERQTEDGEIVLEWAYDYVNVSKADVQGDLQRSYSKTVRGLLMDALAVTTVSGKQFDADETSQTRMARALKTAEVTGQTITSWVLADNTVADVGIDEMEEALSLAMQAQSDLWFV